MKWKLPAICMLLLLVIQLRNSGGEISCTDPTNPECENPRIRGGRIGNPEEADRGGDGGIANPDGGCCC